MAFKVSMFSDFICPFCYIGFEIIRKLESELDFELEWRGYEIHPEWPAEGIAAERVYRSMSQEARAGIWARISAMADAAGVTMHPPTTLTNSHAALMAEEYAREQGKGKEFEKRIYRAYFEEGLNIGDVDTLSRLGTEVGLAPEGIAEATTSPRYEMILKNNALVANRRGVGGVPTFFIGDFPLVGAQSEDVMRQLISRAIERQISMQ